MPDPAPLGRSTFLSTEYASRRRIQAAVFAVLVSVAFFVAAIPFAARALVPIPAFIPAYESALVICDLITAVLLFSQYTYLRSRAQFVLACGYVFTAVVAILHALSFPGVFAPAGMLGGGSQTTVWLYMFWHGGFPLFVIGYALLKGKAPSIIAAAGLQESRARPQRMAIAAGVIVVVAVLCAVALIGTTLHDALPVLIVRNRFTPVMTSVVSTLWMISFVALALLLWRRPYTVLDLWLMVVMCAGIFDIALSAVFNEARFDVGWYAGRLYGLFAASFLLIVLLFENSLHYARLAQLSAELSVANGTLEQLSLHDGLTGLANRRHFDNYLATQIAIARRSGGPLALILYDVDFFKAYNDHYGHPAGDACLQRVATLLQECCRRPADMAARYGGEEFAMILPGTDLAGATMIAARVKDAMADLQIIHGHSSVSPHVTLSGGMSVLSGAKDEGLQQLVAAADQNLYRAKHLGRNRMLGAQPVIAPASRAV